MLYRLLTSSASSGIAKFADLTERENVKDGEYVFTLHSDYGRQVKAASETFRVEGGLITQVSGHE